MNDFIVGLGVMLAIEGTIYALFASSMPSVLRQMAAAPAHVFRRFGVASLACGVLLIWLIRG